MKKYLILILLLLINTGCKKNKIEKISMECNGIKTEFTVEKGNQISCILLGDEYVFTVKDIKDNGIYIKANKNGLSDSSSLTENKQQFIIDKDSDLKLYTQTTDYQEVVVFKWN